VTEPDVLFNFLRFEILDVLGRGMAVVYLAFDPNRREQVALKLIPLDRTSEEELAAEQLGARLQERLSEVAPQVAKVYEHGRAKGHFYVAMEYVEGRDLAQVLPENDGPLEVDRCVDIALQLCEMLEIAHGLSVEVEDRHITAVIHGDLKPENLRLQEGDRVRILDFGASKVLSATRKVTRNLFGTYPYTPPEQLRSEGLVDERSDLWALGIILYRMVAGRDPYPGPRPQDLVRQILDGPPAPLPADCLPALKQILQRCLSAEPARRYASAAELKNDLTAFSTGGNLAPWPACDDAVTHRVHAVREPADPETTRRVAGKVEHVDRGETGESRDAGGGPSDPTSQGPETVTTLDSEAGTGAATSAPTRTPRLAISRRWLGRLVIAGLAAVALSQVYVRSAAQQIVRQVAAEPSPELEDAWRRYAFSSRFTLFGLGLGRAEESLHAAALALAEQVVSSYRQSRPTTRQGDWYRARDYLQIALRLRPDDPATRARLLYAQAHIDRIDAASLRTQNRVDAAERKWNDAIFRFRRAAQTAPDWPDPLLGLARIHAYDRFDLRALTKALAEAERRGHELAAREKAQLADGHLTEGTRLYRRARALNGAFREEEILDQAAYHLALASARYEEILDFGRAERNRAEALRLADAVRRRLEELR